jgi:catechol-2,3-dioxygenase
MQLILHEIELGTSSPEASKAFYHSVLGLPIAIDQEQLKVFQPTTNGLDFNFSTHLPSKVVRLSFLTNDLNAVMAHLTQQGKYFTGPMPSHLEMTSIQLEDPNGYSVKINMPSERSPQWLKDKAAAMSRNFTTSSSN